MRLARKWCVAAVALLACASTGCLIPEKFDIDISVRKDSTYTVRYDGTVVHPLIRMAAVSGELTAKDEQELKKAERELADMPGFGSVKYLDGGRFQVEYEKTGTLASRVVIFDSENEVLALRKLPDGTVVVEGFAVSKDDAKQLAELALVIDGTVKLFTDGEVLEHNADETPWFGRFGGYSWRIRGVRDNLPHAKVKL